MVKKHFADSFLAQVPIELRTKYDFSNMNFRGYRKSIYVVCPIHGGSYIHAETVMGGVACMGCRSPHICKTEAMFLSQMQTLGYQDKYKVGITNISFPMKLTDTFEVTCSFHGAWNTNSTKFFLKKLGCPGCRDGYHARKNKYSDDELLSIVRGYKHYGEFVKNTEIYAHCYRRGLLEKIKDFNLPPNPSHGLKNRLIYVYEFDDNSAYIGLTCNLERRHHLRLHYSKDTVSKMIQQGRNFTLKALTGYVDQFLAKKLEGDFVEEYKLKGWTIKNIAKPGALGYGIPGCRTSYEEIKQVALQYTQRGVLRREREDIYGCIIRNKWWELLDHTTVEKPYKKKIVCEDTNVEYASIAEASRILNINYNTLFAAVRERRRCGGLLFYSKPV